MIAGRLAVMFVRLLAGRRRRSIRRLGRLVACWRDRHRVVSGLLGGASVPLGLFGGQPGALCLGVALGLSALRGLNLRLSGGLGLVGGLKLSLAGRVGFGVRATQGLQLGLALGGGLRLAGRLGLTRRLDLGLTGGLRIGAGVGLGLKLGLTRGFDL
jgi:hypothetical protein